jgi:PadR family transcriptional regulator, regulatory protein AphA
MMEYQVKKLINKTIIETQTDGKTINNDQDALDLIAACGENGTTLLLLLDGNLSDEFFDLSTGLAGKLLLKFGNYSIRTAAVISRHRAEYGKFPEMMIEQNRGNDFRFFYDREKAEDWLLRQS